jgi:hypothetical protein
MTQQNNQTGAAGLDPKSPGPAESFLREQQTLTGAHATGGGQSGTPAAQGSSAASGSGGGTASASPPATPEGQAQQAILDGIAKLNKRLDNQAQYMQGLDGSLKQTRKDFETKYTEPRYTGGGEGGSGGTGEEPPPIDAKKLANQVIGEVLPAVKEYLGEYLAPVLQQTRSNTAAQIIANAQHDPAVKRLVDELPPQVRATLAQDVHRKLGNDMFAEPDVLYDGPDPVAETIELIHYRTVVKTGYQPQTQAGEQTHQAGVETHSQLSPVPTTGTRTETPFADPEKDLAERIYNIKIDANSRQYPAGIGEELRQAGV